MSVFHALKPTENIFFNYLSWNVWQHFIRFLIFCFIQFLNKIDRDYSDFKENFWISFLPFKNQRRFFFKPDLPVIIWRRRTFTKHLCLNQFKAKLTEILTTVVNWEHIFTGFSVRHWWPFTRIKKCTCDW